MKNLHDIPREQVRYNHARSFIEGRDGQIFVIDPVNNTWNSIGTTIRNFTWQPINANPTNHVDFTAFGDTNTTFYINYRFDEV